MPDLQQQREALAKAEQDVAEGERRVAHQKALIARMAQEGRDTALAEDFLRTLEQTPEQWHIHRRLILDALARR